MIYFMQPPDGGPIKIGYSDAPDVRHKALQLHYGRELVILATMNGGREREAEIHLRFAHLRFGITEQFRPDSELLDFIEKEGKRWAKLKVVKVNSELVSMARYVADQREILLAEYLSELLAAPVKRDFAKAVKQTGGESE